MSKMKENIKKEMWDIILKHIVKFPELCCEALFNPRQRHRVIFWLLLLFRPLYFLGFIMIVDIISCVIEIVRLFRKEKKSRPSTIVDECYSYVVERLELLSASRYTEGHQHSDWGQLPVEIKDNWKDMEHYIEILYTGGILSEESKNILSKIKENFDTYSETGEKPIPEIWLPESLKAHPFWKQQRKMARKALHLLKYNATIPRDEKEETEGRE